MRLLAAILFLLPLLANGATYYVRTNGNDSADGSSGTPWLTVQKAATTAPAGMPTNWQRLSCSLSNPDASQ